MLVLLAETVPAELGNYRLHAGQSAELDALMQDVLEPPIERIGALPTNSFVKKAERRGLAATLNTLMASPSLASWRRGANLDVADWLGAGAGARRVAGRSAVVGADVCRTHSAVLDAMPSAIEEHLATAGAALVRSAQYAGRGAAHLDESALHDVAVSSGARAVAARMRSEQPGAWTRGLSDSLASTTSLLLPHGSPRATCVGAAK